MIGGDDNNDNDDDSGMSDDNYDNNDNSDMSDDNNDNNDDSVITMMNNIEKVVKKILSTHSFIHTVLKIWKILLIITFRTIQYFSMII